MTKSKMGAMITTNNLLDKISALSKRGIRLGLENMSDAVNALGIDLSPIRMIHVAGTNGKGSTAAFLHRLITDHAGKGKRTGMLISPHLIKYNERISINDRKISDEEICKYADRIFKETDRIPLTYFEFTTLLSFMFFCGEDVDYAVIEAGLGGRLDATNVISPEICIITSIGLDHMEYLGSTLKEIAIEKAGVFKPGSKVILSRTPCNQLLKEKALSVGVSESYELDSEFTYKACSDEVFDYIFNKETLYHGLKKTLAGDHQYNNVTCALTAFHLLGLKGTNETINNSIKKVHWPGRLESRTVCDKQVYIDVSHNEEGMEQTIEYFRRHHPSDDIYVACGFMKDKNYTSMINSLSAISKKIFLVPTAEKGRELSKKDYANITESVMHNHVLCDNYEDAVEKIMQENGIILFTGSIYNYAHVSRLLEDRTRCSG